MMMRMTAEEGGAGGGGDRGGGGGGGGTSWAASTTSAPVRNVALLGVYVLLLMTISVSLLDLGLRHREQSRDEALLQMLRNTLTPSDADAEGGAAARGTNAQDEHLRRVIAVMAAGVQHRAGDGEHPLSSANLLLDSPHDALRVSEHELEAAHSDSSGGAELKDSSATDGTETAGHTAQEAGNNGAGGAQPPEMHPAGEDVSWGGGPLPDSREQAPSPSHHDIAIGGNGGGGDGGDAMDPTGADPAPLGLDMPPTDPPSVLIGTGYGDDAGWFEWRNASQCFPNLYEQAMQAYDRVSVVVTLKDRSKAFLQAVQTWLLHDRVDEIVIVDWSSTIPMHTVLQNAGIQDRRIRIFRVDAMQGFSIARSGNLGFKVASGTKILKLDSDTRLEADFFTSHPLPDGANYFYRGLWNQTENSKAFLESPLQFDINHLNGIFYAPRYALSAVNGFDERICEYGHDDEGLYNRMFYTGQIPKVMLPYRVTHLDHPRSREASLDEIASTIRNLRAELHQHWWYRRDFGNWSSLHSFRPSPTTGECMTKVEFEPPCFKDLYSPEDWQDLVVGSMRRAISVACGDCVRSIMLKDVPLEALRMMSHFFSNTRPHRYAVAVLRGRPHAKDGNDDKAVLCRAIAFAQRYRLNIGIMFSTSTGNSGFAPYYRTVHGLYTLLPDGRKLVTVPGVFPQLFTRRFFVTEESTTSFRDVRHVLFGWNAAADAEQMPGDNRPPSSFKGMPSSVAAAPGADGSQAGMQASRSGDGAGGGNHPASFLCQRIHRELVAPAINEFGHHLRRRLRRR